MDISKKNIKELDPHEPDYEEQLKGALFAFLKNVGKSKTVCDLYARKDEAKLLLKHEE